MKKSTKLIAILTVIALLVCTLAAAIADDRIFTSEVFSIPKERVEQTILQQPGEETSKSDSPDQAGQHEDSEEPEIGSDEWWDADSGEKPETLTEPEEGTETGTSSEGTPPEESSEGDTETEPMPERKVQIKSSRKDVVIEGEIITLYSRLTGFEDVEVHYQWQVDRGDGAGWQDVEGATGPEHSFVARKDTILYSWRLTIITDE